MNKQYPDTLGQIADFIFTSKYARHLKELNRRETWEETVTRVEQMHLKKYDFLSNEDKAEIVKAFDHSRRKEVVPSMRSMQFGGPAIEAHNAKIYNCLKEDTKFVTSEGVKSFNDFEDGDKITVLGPSGRWLPATVKYYGEGWFDRITIAKGKNETVIFASDDHRWLNRNGEFQEGVNQGDQLAASEDMLSRFDWDSAPWDEKLYWCYGLAYGDGVVNNGYTMLRLCGSDKNYKDRFESFGFKSSTSQSLNGDHIVYLGKYQKTAPDPAKDDPRLIRAFVRGYLDADGEKSDRKSDNKFLSIQSSDKDHIEFIRDCFPVAGAFIISETDLTGEQTNFGTRPFTIKFRVSNYFSPQSSFVPGSHFRVTSVQPDAEYGSYWCLEVEEDKAFVLPNGLVTGNCAVRHIDSIRSFAEVFYLLLCGCGVGTGLTNKYLNRLPNFVGPQDKTGTVITYVIEDTIEGWADSVEALLNCYFVNTAYSGRRIIFDYSKIRKEGSILKTGGGKAPGYKGLKAAHLKIKALMDNIIETLRQNRLKTINAYDIMMHCSDAVLSGGVRRSAMSVMFSKDDMDMMNAKRGNWFAENPQRARSNNSVVLIRDEVTLEEFIEIIEITREWGEPGFVFADTIDVLYNPCFEIAFVPVTEDGVCGVQFCVAGDTKLITKDGLVDISASINKNIEIWNGSRWVNVQPFQTGTKDKLYRVYFSDGSKLDATNNHKFLVKANGWEQYKEMTTLEIKEYISKYKIQLHIPRANILGANEDGVKIDSAYEYGFFKGDGHLDHGVPKFNLYADDKKLCLAGERGSTLYNSYGTEYEVLKPSLNTDLCHKLKRQGLPSEIFSWHRESLLNFFAGWIDADGSKANNGARLYGDRPSIEIAQILLTKLGIVSSLNLMQKAGTITNLGERKNDVWYLQIPDASIIPSRRLDLSNGQVAKFKGKYQIISSIEELDGLHPSYCLEEPNDHLCVFNNVLTKQCNLTSANGSKVKTPEDFYRFAEASAILGTLQAGYTHFPYLSNAAKQLTEEEALLGCSITAMMDNIDVNFDPEVQSRGAEIVVETNRIWAAKLGINQAARTTDVKPEGTSTLALGSMASGVHASHAHKMFRRVQINKLDNAYQFFKQFNPHLCEEGVWSANKTDDVITFPIQLDSKVTVKADISTLEHLNMIRSTQKNWVMPGTTKANKKPVHHNVSCTVVVQEDEWHLVARYLFNNRSDFSAVSLLAATGDKDYAQAPMEAINTIEDHAKFEHYMDNFIPVNFTYMEETEDGTSLMQEISCAGGACIV